MKNDILKHCKEYYNNPEDGFYPISEKDAEILFEFKKAFKKQIKDSGLLNLFSDYKEKKTDDFLLKELREWNNFKKQEKDLLEDEDPDLEEPEEDEKLPRYLEICDELISCNFLTGIRKGKSYSEKEQQLMYYIIINPNPSEKALPNTNLKFEFFSERYRDKVIDKIKEVMDDKIEIFKID